MKRIEMALLEPKARLILEALTELEAKWATVCETSEDEDESR